MSKEKQPNLVGAPNSSQELATEAMNIQDQATMENYIRSQGYNLSKKEMLEIWAMTARAMAGHDAPMPEV